MSKIKSSERIKLLKLLNECENVLDSRNAEQGNSKMYCLCCMSTEYNGREGIIHDNDCLIKRIRGVLPR